MKQNFRIIKVLLSAIVILMAAENFVFGQINQHWVKKYKGEDSFHDFGNAVAADMNGNIYLGGTSDSTGGNRFYVNKYNSSGTLLWTALYNNSDLSGVVDIAVDNNYGNVTLVGTKGHLNNTDIVVVKFNFSGVLQWARVFNGPGNNQDIPSDLTVDGQGNYFVTGFATNTLFNRDYVTLKYDYNGNLSWAAYYDRTAHHDYGNSIAVDNGGNVYVTGTSGEPNNNPTQADIVTLKYNSSGAQQWTSWYWGVSDKDEAAFSLVLDNSGNIFVSGFDQDTSNNNAQRPVLIKINNSGIIQWTRIFYGEAGTTVGSGYGRSLVSDNSGNIFVCGEYLSVWERGNDAMTLKYNTNGDLQWSKLYDFNGNNDYAREIKLDASGNPHIAVEINQAVTGYYLVDIVTIKYSSVTGVQDWLTLFDRGRDYPADLVINNSGDVFVAGTIDEHLGWGRANDAVLIKYSPGMVGIQGITGELPSEFSLKQNYPNPFNPSTNIEFWIPRASFVKLAVYDITGKEIEIILNSNLNRGTYKVNFNAAKFSSGIYFYVINAGGFTETKKMILTK